VIPVPTAALVSFFQVVLVSGCALTALKLLISGLFRRYRVFFWYFLFRVPNSTWPLFLSVKSPVYEKLWAVTEPVAALFYILLVLELYRLILERHRGLYTLGRWVMYLAIGVSVTISVLSLLPRITPATPQRSRIIGYVLASERGVHFSLAIFILLILFFLSRYPVPLSRNVAVHSVVFSVFFLSNTLGLLLRSVFGLHVNDEVNLFLMGTSSACVVAWLVLLNARGEEVRLIAPHFGHGDEDRILLQLDSLNSTLLNVSRK
jgi:hypothetical protein